MMLNKHFEAVDPFKISRNPFQAIGKDWFLITAGTPDNFNTMTAAWGSFGILWNKAVVTIYIRPTRYTYEFSEANDFFSICFFGEEHRDILAYCGKHSGRDVDKVKVCGLRPIETPNHQLIFAEANLAMECRKLYTDDLKKEHFLDSEDLRHYPINDFHRFYVGEITHCWEKTE
jgi:flavin reductase (DIM6/NTAB) family NADH-FMN oxidoreductase RutF